MTKLDDTQLILLSAAAARDDGAADWPAQMNRARGSRAGAKLVAGRLMREIRSKPGMPVWRKDEEGRPLSLVILKAGREAIGVLDDEAAVNAECVATKPPSGKAKGKLAATEERGAKPALVETSTARKPEKSAAAPTGRTEGGRPMAAAGQDEVPQANSNAKGKVASKPAALGLPAAAPAHAVSAGEEDRAGSKASSLPSPEAPRVGSKQALLVGMLSAEQGATIEALIAATGWLPHTTRAVLTGLRKRGYAIERLRAGDRGPSVYRIASRVATGMSVGA